MAASGADGSPQIIAPVTVYTKDNVPATPKLEDLPERESVTQYGIAWTFEKPARVGQFITGDYYLVGPWPRAMADTKPQKRPQARTAKRSCNGFKNPLILRAILWMQIMWRFLDKSLLAQLLSAEQAAFALCLQLSVQPESDSLGYIIAPDRQGDSGSPEEIVTQADISIRFTTGDRFCL